MKGKTYSDEFKEQVLKEVEETGNAVVVARNHDIPYTTIITSIEKKMKINNTNCSRGPRPNDFNTNSSNKEIEKKMISSKSCLVKKTWKLPYSKTF
jgi:hypothetical protein